MRLEATRAADQDNVWLTDEEIPKLHRTAATYRDDVITQLCAFVGLRAFEIPQVTPDGITETEIGQYRSRVSEGKDTTGNGGKSRDAYLPFDIERSLKQFQNAENIPPKEPFVELSERGVPAVMNRTVNAVPTRPARTTSGTFRATISDGASRNVSWWTRIRIRAW